LDLGAQPNYENYAARLFGETCREIFPSDSLYYVGTGYQEIFPTRLKKGHAKAMDFETEDGGGVFASSLNGIITGIGAEIIIVDYDISDVRNPGLLDDTVATFLAVVRSKLNDRKTGRILVIVPRSHDRDLSVQISPF
jgi:hypothetical protein